MFRSQVGIAPLAALALVFGLAIVGAGLAVLFPKYQATALLRTPADPATETLRKLQPPPPPAYLTLPEFKRAMAAFASTERLSAFLSARGMENSAAAQRLLVQSRNPGYWDAAVDPAFPISRRDQREIGDARDQAAPASLLLGVRVAADARQRETALEMVRVLGEYLADGFVLERVRAWVAAGRREAETAVRTLRADLLKVQMDIRQTEQRVVDTKAILARYPDASRLEGRQVLGVNASDGSDRFLSPLSQLVSLESLISQQREKARRLERELKQTQALLTFFAAADERARQDVAFESLQRGLQELATAAFAGGDAAEEWLAEAGHRTAAGIGYFERLRAQMGLRGDDQAELRALRSPVAFAALFAVAGMLLIGAVALLRATAAYVDRARAQG